MMKSFVKFIHDLFLKSTNHYFSEKKPQNPINSNFKYIIIYCIYYKNDNDATMLQLDIDFYYCVRRG